MPKIDYNEISRVYDKVRLGDPIIIQRMLDSCVIDKNSRVLDIGCGTGNNAALLYNVTSAQVHGIDQSEGMLEKAREKSEKIKYMQGDAVTLEGLGDNEFDIVYMIDVIHHIKDMDTMFRNIYRVLREDGVAFVFTDSHDQIKNNRLVSKYFPETIEPELARYPETREMISSMGKSNFKNIIAEDVVYPEQMEAGEKLFKIAAYKGYSMFHLISDEAWNKGREKLEAELKAGPISSLPRMLMLMGRK